MNNGTFIFDIKNNDGVIQERLTIGRTLRKDLKTLIDLQEGLIDKFIENNLALGSFLAEPANWKEIEKIAKLVPVLPNENLGTYLNLLGDNYDFIVTFFFTESWDANKSEIEAGDTLKSSILSKLNQLDYEKAVGKGAEEKKNIGDRGRDGSGNSEEQNAREGEASGDSSSKRRSFNNRGELDSYELAVLLKGFPENAVWMWENLDRITIHQILHFTVEFNEKEAGEESKNSNGSSYRNENSITAQRRARADKMDEKVIDVNDPEIKAKITAAKIRHGLIR